MGSPSGDRMPKDLPDGRSKPLRRFELAPRLDLPQHGEDFGRKNVLDRPASQSGQSETQEPFRLGDCDHGLLLTTLLVNQFSRNRGESVLGSDGLFDLGLFLRF